MKSNLFKVIFAVSVVYLISMYFMGKSHSKKVLGVQENATPVPTATETIPSTASPSAEPMDSTPSTGSGQSSLTTSPSAQPMDSAVLTTSPSAQPTLMIPPASSSEINSFIDRFSSQYGVDPNVLRYIAICESGFRSNAYNAGYAGLYQFGPTTWKNIREEFGEDINPDLRYSAEESVQTAAYALSRGKGGIWPNCQP